MWLGALLVLGMPEGGLLKYELFTSLHEALAEFTHNQWIFWSKGIAKTEKLSEKRLERWRKLWVPYETLPEKTKKLNRELANRILEIIDKFLEEAEL